MLKAYKYELKPTPEQAQWLNQTMGNCRFLYNLALETKIAAYQSTGKTVSAFDLMKQLTDLKKDHDWLCVSPVGSLQHAISNLDTSFSNFFRGKAKFPRFKRKNDKQSFHLPQDIKVDFNNFQVTIPKIKQISIAKDRTFEGQIRNATVSKMPSGRYYISILVQDGKEWPKSKKVKAKTTVGIDVGLKHFAVLSDCTKVDNPKLLSHALKRLRVEKRTLARRFKKGSKEQSKRYQKQKLVVAKLHEHIANQRKDFTHKLSTAIVKQYDTVCVENLNIRGMVKNHNLSRAISDVGWGMFKEQLQYKCEWYGKNFRQIGTFEPSSKMCTCGKINNELTLDQREWTCQHCGARHDRDLLAAKNIKTFGLQSKPSSAKAGR